MILDDVFDEIIESLNPARIPLEYLTAAKWTDNTGREHIVTDPAAIEHFRCNPNAYSIAKASMMVDIKRIKLDMWLATDMFESELRRRVLAQWNPPALLDD